MVHTVTLNGCDYLLHVGETTGTDTYGGTADLKCPAEAHIVLHVFLNTKHTIPLCTINIAAQNGLKGGTLKDETNGHLTLGGTIGGIHVSKEGACGSGSTENVELHLAATIEGKNAEGNVGVSISHE